MTFFIAALVLAPSAEVPKASKPWWTLPKPTISIKKPTSAKEIVVDIRSQKLIAVENGETVMTLLCCTGRNNATPRGAFPIRQKLRYNQALPKYGGAPIPYSLRLDIVKNGRRVPIAIHAYKSVPRVPSSHGCIRLKHADAAKLFQWAEVGLTVTIR